MKLVLLFYEALGLSGFAKKKKCSKFDCFYSSKETGSVRTTPANEDNQHLFLMSHQCHNLQNK